MNQLFYLAIFLFGNSLFDQEILTRLPCSFLMRVIEVAIHLLSVNFNKEEKLFLVFVQIFTLAAVLFVYDT